MHDEPVGTTWSEGVTALAVMGMTIVPSLV
jgi:hypothetical protein